MSVFHVETKRREELIELTGALARQSLELSAKDVRLEIMSRRISKLELKVKEQNEIIVKQGREINELKTHETKIKVTFEGKFVKLQNQFEKQSSELFDLIKTKELEIDHLNQQILNSESSLHQLSSEQCLNLDPPPSVSVQAVQSSNSVTTNHPQDHIIVRLTGTDRNVTKDTGGNVESYTIHLNGERLAM